MDDCLICYHFALDYQTWETTYCPDKDVFLFSNYVGIPKTQLETAQLFCATDDNCYGVYDAKCDGQSPFKLCRSNYKLKSKYTPCTYSKTGNHLFICHEFF